MDKDKFFERLLIFAWIFMLFFCLALLSFTSHAASDQDYFPMQQAQNGYFTQGIVDKLNTVLDSQNNYIFVAYAFDSGQYRYFNYVTVPQTSNNGIPCIYGEKFNNLYQFSLYKNPNNITVSAGQINFDTTNPNRYGNIGYGNTLSYFGNMTSSNYSSSTSYMSNFIVYTNNTSTRKMVLFYDDGSYIPPDDTAREDMDKPDPDDYFPEWTNKPSFDNSTVEAALGSVYNIISWVGDNIKNSIIGLGKYITDSMLWGMQKIINNIREKLEAVATELQEAIEDFSQTVSGYLSDIQDSFDYLTEPIDPDVLYDTYSGTAMASDIGSIQTNFTSFVTQFNDISEPNTYKIPVHFESITMFQEVGVQYIDLGWIDPVKSVLRAFLWCITTYGLIAAIFDAIPKYINGGGDEGD